MTKVIWTTLAASLMILTTYAQRTPTDTVIVELGKTSQVIFTIRDKQDLDILKQYDFQALFRDIFAKLQQDTTYARGNDQANDDDDDSYQWQYRRDRDDDDDDDDEYQWRYHSKKRYWGKTWHSFNIDLGTNNIIEENGFPDGNAPYRVRPWGSWYVGLNSIQKTKVAGKFFVEWGLGVSWYNFKFQNDDTRIIRTDTGLEFTPDDAVTRNYIKSKLTASYINASLIPVIDFGERKRNHVWNDNGSFHFGLGPYVGYRLGSYTKAVFKEGGSRERDRDRDDYYLNNLRYGLRAQIGFRSTSLFFNYDLNELFQANRGPKVNAMSFGIIL